MTNSNGQSSSETPYLNPQPAPEPQNQQTLVTMSALLKRNKENATYLPSWYRALLSQARVQPFSTGGYRQSYSDAGWHLAIHWSRYVEEDQLEAAEASLASLKWDDTAGAVRWLRKYAASFMKAAPSRRHENLARGFLKRLYK